jgi:hypothetical protein
MHILMGIGSKEQLVWVGDSKASGKKKWSGEDGAVLT